MQIKVKYVDKEIDKLEKIAVATLLTFAVPRMLI